jgi:acetylornithine deacetylase
MTLTARQILDRLVGFPTVSRDSNLDLIDWVEGYLDDFGVRAHRTWNEDETKAGLFANVGPEVEGGIILSGHTDVVPVDGQQWSSDPFTVTERNGKLYGRGCVDMKGFAALALAAVPLALERGVRRPLQIALSYDEEVGCTGAPPMIDDMVRVLPRASAAIIGEPSMMKAVTGHKGGIGFLVTVRGYEVHSSLMHQGVNAIMEAAKLIDWANEMNTLNAAKDRGPLTRLFEPPWTTIHVGQISGGTAHNITAAECHFGVSFRIVPGEPTEDWAAAFIERVTEVEAGMKTIRPEAQIEVEPHFDVPGLKPEKEGSAEALVRRITGDNGQHMVSYGTEAGQFQVAGYSSVVCGPGNIAQAHQPDEFITVEQFQRGEAFVGRVVEELCD